MKSNKLRKILLTGLIALAAANFALAQTTRQRSTNVVQTRSAAAIEERGVRAAMEFLASDALQGRGSGTEFERLAGQYIGSQLRQFGVEPAGETDSSGAATYLQTVKITRNSFAANPKLTYAANGAAETLEHGGEMLVFRMTAGQIAGELQKINLDGQPKSGAVVFVRLRENENTPNLFQNLQQLAAGGARAVIVEETAQIRAGWTNYANRKISFTNVSGVAANNANIIFVSKAAAARLAAVADGTPFEIKGELNAPENRQTWNAVGKITGTDSRLASEVILLSAHLDHLGVRENAPGADKIFNGADDDASGCVAVLELARVLASGKRPKRTVHFAFFGSEEAGGYGAQFYVSNLPYPKEKLVANLEFEMIGRADAKVKPEELWLTGYDRSNLGAELARQGARLVADPHPEENFFQRSDNYTLARQGVIAHTVSSFGLHTDYHKASDEVKTIDFQHMTRSINSMVAPVQWLVNSDFKPAWYEGKKP